MTISRIAIALSLVGLGSPVLAGDPAITVCPTGCDYSSLGDALDAVSAGDDVRIHVFAGTYDDGPFNFAGSSGATVRIIGIDGAENTILTPGGSGRVFFVGNGDALRLEGLTISGGNPGGSSSQGAGVKVVSGGSLELVNCIVRDNVTDGDGAGVYLEDGATGLIEDCLFQDNHIVNKSTTSRHGGGLHVTSIDGSTVDRCRFISNSCPGYGGGLFLGRLNQAPDVVEAFPQVRNCLFVDNEAGFNGGGAYVEPALLGCEEPEVIGYVTNCTFIGNASPKAGAIYGSQRIWCGGSLGTDAPSTLVLNSILWANGPDYPSDYPVTFNNCVLDYLEEFSPGESNSNLAPRFFDVHGEDGIPWNGDGDYRLLPGSDGIDHSTAQVGTILPVAFGPYDVSGRSRDIDHPLSGYSSLGYTVDIGAYEMGGAELPFDIAYWVGGGGTPAFLDPTNWFLGLVPSPDRVIIHDATATASLFGNANISSILMYAGTLEFTGGSPGTVTLGDEQGLDPLLMGQGGESPKLILADGMELVCSAVDVVRGRLKLNGASLRVEDRIELLQSTEEADTAGAPGVRIGTLHGPGTISRVDPSDPADEFDPVLVNRGRIRLDGVMDVEGDYEQVGGILRVQRRVGDNIGPDRRIDIDGRAALAGSVVFDIQPSAWDPPVGSTFTILTASEGFEPGRDAFEFSVTQWYGDPRFFICSTVENAGGTGSSIVATVATIDSLVSADPALEQIGISLEDMLLVDIDGDGTDDLVLSVDAGGGSDGQVVVLLNQGNDGSGNWNGFEQYSTAFSITVGKGPRGLDAGFIDAGSAEPDANYDLLVANEGAGTVSLIQNNSTIGSVGLAILQTVDLPGPDLENIYPTDVCALNLDDDANGYSDMLVACATGAVWSYRNLTAFHGFGGMDSPEESKPDEPIAEFEPGLGGGGGVRDTGPSGRSRSGGTVEVGRVDGLFGPGGIQVTWQSYPLPPGSEPSGIAVADLDDDGFDDVITSNAGDASLSILMGSGVGAFNDPITIPLDADYTETEAIDTGDVDGDGDLDIMLVCLGPETDPLLGPQKVLRTVRNTLNQGGYGWVFDLEEGLRGFEPYLVRTADVDLDGVDDVIALTEASFAFNGPSFGLATMVITPEVESCLGDINGDELVNGADMGLLLAEWGPCATCQADFNDDGMVSGADLGLLLSAWGPCQGADGGS